MCEGHIDSSKASIFLLFLYLSFALPCHGRAKTQHWARLSGRIHITADYEVRLRPITNLRQPTPTYSNLTQITSKSSSARRAFEQSPATGKFAHQKTEVRAGLKTDRVVQKYGAGIDSFIR